MNNYLKEKDFILGIMKEAITLFTKEKPVDVKQKSRFDLVTDIDTKIENYLIEKIKTEFVGDTVLSEEGFSNALIGKRTWIIDPIDGTCNMVHGNRIYGMQLCLCENGIPVMSVMSIPSLNEFYWAIKGEGAYLNGQRIRVSSETTLDNSIIGMGDYSHRATSLAEMQLKATAFLYPKVAKIRMAGSACVDFVFVASGKYDATIILTTNLWDLVPGLFMCMEADAVVTNPQGTEYKFGDNGVVASSNKALHELIITALN